MDDAQVALYRRRAHLQRQIEALEGERRRLALGRFWWWHKRRGGAIERLDLELDLLKAELRGPHAPADSSADETIDKAVCYDD